MNLPDYNKELEQVKLLNEQVQTRESMFEYSSNTYRKLFNTSPDPVALIRLSDGRLLESNYRFEKLLGYSKDEFRVLGIDFFLNKDIKRIKKIAKKALRNERWFETECKLLSRNDGLIRVAITASLIRHDEQTLVQASIRPLP